MESINSNGQSPAGNMWSGSPRNRTKPGAPTNAQATAGQTNRIPLQWTSPTNNQTGSDQLSCNGTGGSTNGSVIPPQEIVKFRVSRGTDAGFDPNNAADPGVQILGFTSASQPPPSTGGATVTWNDSGTTSSIYPANCVDYYYRIAAVDRCYRQGNWNQSNNPNDSISAYSAVIGPFRSTSNTAPAPPATVSVDRSNDPAIPGHMMSECPDPSAPTSPNCRIYLNWQSTLTDIASPANQIGIDSYVITRRVRNQSAGGNFANDVTFGTAGSMEVNCTGGTCASGYSQIALATPRSFVDYPVWLNPGGQVLEYQYTVAAKNCSLYSGNSPYSIVEASENQSGQIAPLPPGPNPYVVYPGCSTNPTIIQSGGTGTGTGDSPTSPWIFNSGDQVTVTPGAGSTVTSVDFQLFTWPTPAQVGLPQSILTPGPYIFTWGNQAGTDTYTLRITVHTLDATGAACDEVHIKYIQQQAPSNCFFSNVAPPAPIIVSHPANPETDHIDFTVTNSGNEPIRFNMAPNVAGVPSNGPTFQGQYFLTWSTPDLPNHTDLAITSIVWNGTITQTMCAFASCTAAAGQGAGGSINTLTSSGTTATVTTSVATAGVSTGDKVTINNINNAAFNGTFTVTSVLPNRFTYTFAGCGNCSGSQANSNGMLWAAQRKINLAIPATMPNIAPGATFTIRVNLSFDGHGSIPSLPSSPSSLLKLCLRYRILSEMTVDKNCNLVGASGTTLNPTSCD